MSEINYQIKPFQPASAEERDNCMGTPSGSESRSQNKALPQSPEGSRTPADTSDCGDTSPLSPTRRVASNQSADLSAHALLPGPVAPMRRLALAKGAEWCRILREARPYLRTHTLAEAATIAGTSAATLHRLLRQFGKMPDHELTPENLAPAFGGGAECEWEFLLKDEAVRRKLLDLYLATMGASSARAANDRRTAKIATALKQFIYEPECPDRLRERLRAGYQPSAFKKFLRAAVTPEMEAKIRGPKHYQLHGPSSVRDWSCRLPNGDRFECPAAWTLSADDMSVNHPFYIERADGSTILSRQGLYFLWAKHKVWASVDLIARPRESYTAADILRAFYRTCLALGGVPPFVEFEQGIWKANKISGFTIDGDWIVEESVERPAMAEADKQVIVQGLGLCGIAVKYKTKAHQKHIETHFNYLQTILAITARSYQCIGRYAGEFEMPGKQLRRVRAGSHHPRDLHFANQAQMAECVAEAMRRVNEMPAVGRVSPSAPAQSGNMTRAEAHEADLQQVPLLPLTPRLFAACLPGELKKTTISGGYISVQAQGRQYEFRDDLFIRLGDGYELFYKFDETDPNLGAAIFNRTPRDAGANFQRWQPGEFICNAAREIPGPKLEVTTAPAGVRVETVEERYGAGAVDRGDLTRRRQDKFVSTQFRAMPRPGQIPVRSASARDGRGNVATIEHSDRARLSERAAEAPQADSSNPAAALPPRVQPAGRALLAPANARQFSRQSDRLARQAERAQRLRELQPT